MKVTKVIDADFYGVSMVEYVVDGKIMYRDYETFLKEYGYDPLMEFHRIEARERVILKESAIANHEFVTLGICDLVDRLGIRPGMISYDEECEAVNSWCHRWDVLLYERPRELFFTSEGIELAKAGGYRGVLYSDLS